MTATRKTTSQPNGCAKRGYAAVPEQSSKKPGDSADDLHERARKLQETLKRLLQEINQLLDKTKQIGKGEKSAGSESAPKDKPE